jgi:hypothetical protein
MKSPVKYFTAILTGEPELLPDVLKRLKKYFGEADIVGHWVDFTFTNFYEPEMGPNLKRCVVSFTKKLPADALPKAKAWTAKVEDKFRLDKKRRVNIDAGYMDFCKVILASGKFGGHKIALTEKCYADMILDYRKGEFHPFPWCFPDFAGGAYNQTLLEMRQALKHL